MRSTPASTRQVVAAALTLLALGAIGAFQAGFAGADFMYDLEQVQPALAKTQPLIDPAPTPRVARRVFLVIIDGLGFDRSHDLPFLGQLRQRGTDNVAMTHYPSWSRPNYVSILTGVPPASSGVRTNYHYTPVMIDSLMDRTRAAGLRAAVATDYDVLPRLFLRHRTGSSRAPIEFEIDDEGKIDSETIEDPITRAAVRAPAADLASPFDDARYAPWPGGFSEAGLQIFRGEAELVVLLVGAVDQAGHSEGAESPAYRDAAMIADNAVARVLRDVDLTRDVIVVTADHGHTDSGGHGGVEPEVMRVPLIFAGKGIRAGAVSQHARLVDIAPTVATLLGMPSPGHALGRTLDELLDVPPDVITRRRAADATRRTIMQLTVEVADQQAASNVLEHRALRLALVGGGAIVACVFATLLVRRRVLVLDLKVLLVSVPTFFIVYLALIALLGQRFSPSALPGQGHLAWTLAKYGSVAVVVQLLASMWSLKSRRTLGERLAAANALAWVGLMLTMVPAGLVWAYFPPPYVGVPSPTWLVVIPAAQVAVACAAINVALTLFIEVAIFIARAWQRDARLLE